MSDVKQIENKLFYDESEEKYKLIISTSLLPEIPRRSANLKLQDFFLKIKAIVLKNKNLIVLLGILGLLIFSCKGFIKLLITSAVTSIETKDSKEAETSEEGISKEFTMQLQNYINESITLEEFKEVYKGSSIKLVLFNKEEIGRIIPLEDFDLLLSEKYKFEKVDSVIVVNNKVTMAKVYLK
jgi:hypothetical protein